MRCRRASRTVVLVTGRGPPPADALDEAASDSPRASSPTSAGSLRMSHQTRTKMTAAAQARNVAAARQPQATMMPMTRGMKMSCPVDPALFSRPSITPRWRTNQRWATLAASTDDRPPAPVPTMKPQTRTNSHSPSM